MGMNVTFPFNTGVAGFYGVVAITVVITAVVTVWLNRKNML